eukprot:3858901-Amphidinium_carterae.1
MPKVQQSHSRKVENMGMPPVESTSNGNTGSNWSYECVNSCSCRRVSGAFSPTFPCDIKHHA